MCYISVRFLDGLVSWSYLLLGGHLTQICIKAIFDFFPLIRGKRKRTYFLNVYYKQTITYTLFHLLFIIAL